MPASTYRSGPGNEDERTYSLDDLTSAAEVTPRTVRYYIAEGLLPPPVTTGRNATYSDQHLERLRVIARMKDDFLPLKEIRRRLAEMDDDDIALAAAEIGGDADADAWPAVAMSHAPKPESDRFQPRAARAEDDATSYIRRVREESGPGRRANDRPVPRRVGPDPRETWHRLSIGPDAELIISRRAYQRRSGQIDAALEWIRRMLDES